MTSGVVLPCVVCHGLTTIDDIAIRFHDRDAGICLRCYDRNVGDELHMPESLRRQIRDAAGRDGT